MEKLIYLSGAPRVSTDPRANTGGPRSHILGVIKGFENNGWEVIPYIVGDKFSKKVTQTESSSSLEKSIFLRFLSDIIRLILRFSSQIKVWWLFKSEKVDLVYERYAAFQELGSVFGRRGVKWILETNGIYYKEGTVERKAVFFGKLLRFLEKRAYQKCDLLIVISEELKVRVVQDFGIDPEKILVVPNGVDTSFFKPIPIEKRNDILRIGFAGTLIYYQRLDILLEAIKLATSKGYKVEVVVAGDGIELNRWKNYANQLEISEGVTFLGQVSRIDMPGIINGFDVGYSVPDPDLAGKYVSPLKIYEYMAMAVPVIAYPTEDAKRMINQDNGFLIESLTKENVFQAIEEAIKSNLSSLGENGRKLILKEHSWDKRVQDILSAI